MTELEKAIRYCKAVRDDAKAVLDSGFGKYEGESDTTYKKRKMYAELAIAALEKQTPIKPLHIHEVYPKHDWMRDRDGKIDMSAMSVGFCNGPMCRRCYHSVCEHCNPDWDEDECVVDEHRCPNCKSKVEYKGKRCPDCGQALDWEEA